VRLPSGGLVIDTPGLRELQLWDASQGLGETFEDVTRLFGDCRFSDCAHEREPGCAVRAALDDGTLDASRWESYQKLQRELEHLERRLDKRLQSEARKEWAKRGAAGREAMRLKGRR
jgi:ribosome biogenesis GTPase / thiamine phosphate phosphatase